MFLLSAQPVYATTTHKACDIFESIEFDPESRIASYEIIVDTWTRPLVIDLVVTINGDPNRASFEIVSTQQQIYKATVKGSILSPVDVTGPEKFPFDRYGIDIVIDVQFEPGSFCDVSPPMLKGRFLQPNITDLSRSPPVKVSIELSRPAMWQLVFMLVAFIPLLGLLVLLFKTEKDWTPILGMISSILSWSAINSIFESILNCIPSRNTLSWFELVLVATTITTCIISVGVILWRRKRSK
jgi:hypothetical protein